jgi:hypothetical protein
MVIGLTGVIHRSDRCWFPGVGRSSAPVWLVRLTSLTSQSKTEVAALFCNVVCMHLSRGSCIGSGGSLHMCRLSSLWFLSFGLVALRSLLECVFVSVVSSRFPYLRGPRLVFFKWSCFLPFL